MSFLPYLVEQMVTGRDQISPSHMCLHGIVANHTFMTHCPGLHVCNDTRDGASAIARYDVRVRVSRDVVARR